MELLLNSIFSQLGFLNNFLLYIDPGSGSMLFQILIAGLLGGLFAIKTFWLKIVTFFQKITGKKAASKTENEE
jgi:hypothetical protein